MATVRHNITGSERLVMSLPAGGLHDAAGPDGFVYDYCTLYAVARTPGG